MHLFVIKYKRIIYYILGICLLQGFVSDYIGFHQINYLCDVLLIFLLLLIACKKKNKITRTVKNAEYFSIAVFVVAVLMGWMLNSISIPRALWGVRNYGRFFLFYVFAKYLWTEDDVKLAENLFLKLFPIHVILVSFQYIVEGLNQDLLSGIFGKVAGGNGGLVIYLSIILSIAICRFEYKIIDIRKLICYLLLIFINAALSELKFFFVLSIFLVVWYIAMSKRKGRGMALALFFIIALYIGLQIFYYVFPFWRNYLSLGNILTVISDNEVYSSQFDVGRASVFSKLSPIITKWAGTDALLWGIGLGNGDYSDTFSFLNSAFYNTYGFMHYTWLSLGYLFVEVGYIGTVAYISFFIIIEIKAIIAYQKRNTYYNLLGTFFPMVFMLIMVYNSSLRSNYAYMVFAVLTWQTLADTENE